MTGDDRRERDPYVEEVWRAGPARARSSSAKTPVAAVGWKRLGLSLVI
jgi:hypothetical protein